MTIDHFIHIALEAALFYAAWLGVFALTFVLMDLFMEWYHSFKQARKDKAAKNEAGKVAK